MVTCGRCRQEHEVGARICEGCGKPLFSGAIRRALGFSPVLWLKATAVGQMAPFAVVALLLLGGLALHPSDLGWRQLMLCYGLVGLVTLGVTFPLLKGHYDFAAGPLAGLAACCAALLSRFGAVPAIGGALLVGCSVGLLNGWVIGRTRLSSAMVTIVTGSIALQLTLFYTSQSDLVVTQPLLTTLGEASVAGVPVILSLFLVALIVAKMLLSRHTFWPIGMAPSRAEAAARSTPPQVLLCFLVSGLMSGIAGVLIASAGLAAMGLRGQLLWVLTPVAAALVGGASVASGTGNLRTVMIGAAVIAVTDWLCLQLRMPIAGPVVETPYLVVGLLGDRWKDMTWYMIKQARLGNLLALPDDLLLPMIVGFWRKPSWVKTVVLMVALMVVSGSIYIYIAFSVAHKVPEGTAVVSRVSGEVQATPAGTNTPAPVRTGDTLRPGDLLTAGKGAEALLRFHDGSEVKLYPETEMRVAELSADVSGATVTRLNVAKGTFFARVRKLITRNSSFTVETPVLTLGVRGTAFKVEVGQDQGQVAVGEGQVEVSRELEFSDADTGKVRKLNDTRKADAGQAIEAKERTEGSIVRELKRDEAASLRQDSNELTAEKKRSLLHIAKSGGMPFVWLLVAALYVYFIFVYAKPAPNEFLFDIIRRRTVELEKIHNPTAADAPRLLSLAQMFLRVGQLEKAQEHIQKIIEVDPNSEYGRWALRMRAEIHRALIGR
jgi:ribose/xylose/arabinose/galactoside ABC-type transport system permease subunit